MGLIGFGWFAVLVAMVLLVSKFRAGKLGFLVHKNLCLSRKIRENVVCLVILCALSVLWYMFSPHCVPCCAPNKTCNRKMKQYNNILQFPYVRAEKLSE